MLRDKTKTQDSAQQPEGPHHQGLLSEVISGLEAFFPHHHQSPVAREDSPDMRGEYSGRQPQTQQQQQSRPAEAAPPGQRAVPGRRPLFRNETR